MEIKTFKTILSSFADSQTELESDKNEIVVKVRDEILEISLIKVVSELYVVENGNKLAAIDWIIKRLARLPQLADRILEYIPEEKNFICPNGEFLAEIDKNPDEKIEIVKNSVEKLVTTIGQYNALASNVIYVTSDAGEGKTTVINELARVQANNFKTNKEKWLLLPIQLGGRPFLRFDDVIIASLVNKYRFPIYYYDSFLELVKLGIIVPAFDGFEEMFMISSSGEALSALGQMMNKLDSQGSILIAARKAYFDYKSFTLQAKLFDTIGENYVSFSKIALTRWQEQHFIDYAAKRMVEEPLKVYSVLSGILGSDHSILTRAVLVKQLVDIINSENDYEKLARQIRSGESSDYFYKFVHAIVEREANAKWIDRSGETAKSLISVEDHFYLLGYIAQEMWINNTDSVRSEILEILTDMFADQKKLSPVIHRQIKERIKQHALIVTLADRKNFFSFDHDEFRQFFLGIAIIHRLQEKDKMTILSVLRVSLLPRQTLETIIRSLKNSSLNVVEIEHFFFELCEHESPISYARENLGAITISLITGYHDKSRNLKGLNIPPDSLTRLELMNCSFTDCYFQTNSLENSKLVNCTFINCTFDRFEFYETTVIKNCRLENSNLKEIFDQKSDTSFYNPDLIVQILQQKGFSFPITKRVQSGQVKAPDENLLLVDKVIRRFIKSTQINENVFKLKLGKSFSNFEKNILPKLIATGILEEVDYYGSGNQKRYKLGKTMQSIEKAFASSNGEFNKFLEYYIK